MCLHGRLTYVTHRPQLVVLLGKAQNLEEAGSHWKKWSLGAGLDVLRSSLAVRLLSQRRCIAASQPPTLVTMLALTLPCLLHQNEPFPLELQSRLRLFTLKSLLSVYFCHSNRIRNQDRREYFASIVVQSKGGKTLRQLVTLHLH